MRCNSLLAVLYARAFKDCCEDVSPRGRHEASLCPSGVVAGVVAEVVAVVSREAIVVGGNRNGSFDKAKPLPLWSEKDTDSVEW